MSTKKNQKHNDAGEGAFFARELELLKPEIYKVEYPAMKHAEVMPVSSDRDPAATVISYRMVDIVGVAKIIANYADDLPRADVQAKEFFLPVHTLGVSAGWNDFELAAGLKTGRPIDRSKLMAANEIIMRLADKLAFLGDSTVGLIGFTNITNMPNTVVPTVGGAVTWAAKIALATDAGFNAILSDLMLPFTRIATATKGFEVPDTIALSPSSYAQISQTPRNTLSDLTILEFFKKAHPEVTFIVVPWLETSGTGATRQMIVYRRDPTKLELEIPQDVVVREPERRGLEWIVAITMRFAGLQVRYPLSLDSSFGM